MKLLIAILACLLCVGCGPEGHSVNLSGGTGLHGSVGWSGPPPKAAPGEINIQANLGPDIGAHMVFWKAAPMSGHQTEVKPTGSTSVESRFPPIEPFGR